MVLVGSRPRDEVCHKAGIAIRAEVEVVRVHLAAASQAQTAGARDIAKGGSEAASARWTAHGWPHQGASCVGHVRARSCDQEVDGTGLALVSGRCGFVADDIPGLWQSEFARDPGGFGCVETFLVEPCHDFVDVHSAPMSSKMSQTRMPSTNGRLADCHKMGSSEARTPWLWIVVENSKFLEFPSQFIAREIDPRGMVSIFVPVATSCRTALISPLASTGHLGSLYTTEAISLT